MTRQEVRKNSQCQHLTDSAHLKLCITSVICFYGRSFHDEEKGDFSWFFFYLWRRLTMKKMTGEEHKIFPLKRLTDLLNLKPNPTNITHKRHTFNGKPTW